MPTAQELRDGTAPRSSYYGSSYIVSAPLNIPENPLVRARRENLEAKRTRFSNVIGAAFTHENLVPAVGRFLRRSNILDDYNWRGIWSVPEHERDQLLEGIPRHHWPTFSKAGSLREAQVISEQLRKLADTEITLQAAGWGGFGARVVAGVVDPMAVGAGMATGGVGILAARAKFASSLSNIASGAYRRHLLKTSFFVGAVENAAIEVALMQDNPYKNSTDVLFAALIGGGLGLGGGAFATRKLGKMRLKAADIVSQRTLAAEAQEVAQEAGTELTEEGKRALGVKSINEQRARFKDWLKIQFDVGAMDRADLDSLTAQVDAGNADEAVGGWFVKNYEKLQHLEPPKGLSSEEADAVTEARNRRFGRPRRIAESGQDKPTERVRADTGLDDPSNRVTEATKTKRGREFFIRIRWADGRARNVRFKNEDMADRYLAEQSALVQSEDARRIEAGRRVLQGEILRIDHEMERIVDQVPERLSYEEGTTRLMELSERRESLLQRAGPTLGRGVPLGPPPTGTRPTITAEGAARTRAEEVELRQRAERVAQLGQFDPDQSQRLVSQVVPEEETIGTLTGVAERGEDIGVGDAPRFADRPEPSVVAPTARVWSDFAGRGIYEASLERSRSVGIGEIEGTVVAEYNRAFGTDFEASDATLRDPVEISRQNPDVYHASPECKRFSLANNRIDNFQEADPLDRAAAEHIASVIDVADPPVVTLENVPRYQDSALFRHITDALDRGGYDWKVDIVDAADYGGAMTRPRMILRASWAGTIPDLPAKTGPKDWHELVADLIDEAPDEKIPAWEANRLKEMSKRADDDPLKIDMDQPIITMGESATSTVAYARNAGGPAPTLVASPRSVPRIILPDGRVKRVTPRMMARLMGLSDDFELPSRSDHKTYASWARFAKEMIGNGIHGAISRSILQPMTDMSRTARRIPTGEPGALARARPTGEEVTAESATESQMDDILTWLIEDRGRSGFTTRGTGTANIEQLRQWQDELRDLQSQRDAMQTGAGVQIEEARGEVTAAEAQIIAIRKEMQEKNVFLEFSGASVGQKGLAPGALQLGALELEFDPDDLVHIGDEVTVEVGEMSGTQGIISATSDGRYIVEFPSEDETFRQAFQAGELSRGGERLGRAGDEAGELDDEMRELLEAAADEQPQVSVSDLNIEQPGGLSLMGRSNEGGGGKIFGIPKKWLRISMIGRLVESPSKLVQRWSSISAQDAIPNETTQFLTASEWGFRRMQQVMYAYWTIADDALAKYMAGRGIGAHIGVEEKDAFFDMAGRAVRSNKPHEDENVMQVAEAFRDLVNELGQLAHDSGLRGFEKFIKNPNYVPRLVSHSKIRSMIEKHGGGDKGYEAVVSVWAKGIRDSQDSTLRGKKKLTDAQIRKYAEGYVEIQMNIDDFTSLQRSQVFTGDNISFVRNAMMDLKDAGGNAKFTKEEVDDFLRHTVPKKTGSGEKLTTFAHKRNLINEKATITTEFGTLSIEDMLENNISVLMTEYARNMTGAIATHKILEEMSRAAGQEIHSVSRLMGVLGNDMRKSNMTKEQIARDLEKIDVIMRSISGRRLHQNQSFTNFQQNLRLYNNIRMGGQFGIAQIPEFGAILGSVGWGAALAQMPALAHIFRMTKGGTHPHALIDDLQVSVAGGMSARNNKTLPNMDIAESNPYVGGGKFTRNMRRMARAGSFMSGMTPIHVIQQRAVMLCAAQKFAKIAWSGRKFGKSRLNMLGITEKQAELLGRVIRESGHVKFEEGIFGRRLLELNLSKWSRNAQELEAANTLINALQRWSNRVIQENDIGNMSKWMTKEWGRSVLQFRTFGAVAYEKQFLGRLQMLQMGLRGEYEMAYNSSMEGVLSMVFAGLGYWGSTWANSLGRDDADKFREENLDFWGKIVPISYQRSSFATFGPDILDSMFYFAGFDGNPFTGKTSGLSTVVPRGLGDWAQNPSSELYPRVTGAMRAAMKTFKGDEPHTQRDFRRWAGLLPYQRHIPVTNLLSLVAGEHGMNLIED